jgi:hypothetical protein
MNTRTTQNEEWDAELLGAEPLHAFQSNQGTVEKDFGTTVPVLTGDVLQAFPDDFLQTALYGRVLSQHGSRLPLCSQNGRIFINTNAPFSALVCGVQGSGKSHTTSVLLESCLIKSRRLGTLPAPLSSLVFHYDTGGKFARPCEAAYLSDTDENRTGMFVTPPVTVLVLPNSVPVMKNIYAGLRSVDVAPLHFCQEDINGERLLSMMKVDEGNQMPLYMEAIMTILREMEGNFNYTTFRERLEEQKFTAGQKAMLNIRLGLLDSCLKGGTQANSIQSHFKPGHLTIIDLSSNFMDGSTACGFFDIILGLFINSNSTDQRKLVVLDEAHKYLSDNGSSSKLTESLLSVIRQQRHLGTRVVISTQEPTVVPEKFLDLFSFVIAHKFSSPKWLKHLSHHLPSVATSYDKLLQKVSTLVSRSSCEPIFALPGCFPRNGPCGAVFPVWAHRARARRGPAGESRLRPRAHWTRLPRREVSA